MLHRPLDRSPRSPEQLRHLPHDLAAGTKANSGRADDLFLGRLLAMLNGEIYAQNLVAHSRKELRVRTGDPPFLLRDCVTLVPTSRAGRHVFLSFAPELGADVVLRPPADSMIDGQAEPVHVKIFRPFEVVRLDRRMVDAENFTARS